MPQCKDHSEDFRSQHDLCSEGRVEGEWPTAMVDDDWLESWAQTSQRGSLPKFGHDTDFGWFRMVLVHAGASPRLCLLLGDGRFQVLEVGAAMDAFQRLHCPCVGQGDAGRKNTVQCHVDIKFTCVGCLPSRGHCNIHAQGILRFCATLNQFPGESPAQRGLQDWHQIMSGT